MKKIAFLQSKGGVGSTFVVSNAGILIALKQPVLLVDTQFERADLAMTLNINVKGDLVELLVEFEKGDKPDLVNYISTFPKNDKLKLISSPPVPRRKLVNITPASIMTFISTLHSLEFSYVFFDGINQLNPVSTQLLELVEEVIFILSNDLHSFNAFQGKISILKHHYFPPEKVKIIVNHTHEVSTIDTQDIVKLANPYKVLLEIPYAGDKAVEALDRGVPYVELDSGSQTTKSLQKLVAYIRGEVSEEELIRELRGEKKKKFSLFGGKSKKKESPKKKPASSATDLDAALEEALQLMSDDSGTSSAESMGTVSSGMKMDSAISTLAGAEVEEEEFQVEEKQWHEWKEDIHRSLMVEVNWAEVQSVFKDEKGRDQLRTRVESLIIELMERLHINITDVSDRRRFVQEILDEALGYGPLEPLLKDPDISEIMVNGPFDIYIERKGKIYKTDAKFLNNDQLMVIIDRILSPLGKRVDEAMPYADARLPDGSRVNVIIPPLALNGPTVTIRKFSKKKLQAEDLIAFGSVTKDILEFLRAAVIAKKNILISGGTGTGKTTFLNLLSSYIPNDERIITVEDTAELQLQQEHVVRLEARPPNIEGKGEVTIRDLVINTLRMRPDRIIVGECRGPEALDMLQAMNTGHEGSMTTVHANSPRDALSRLETMIMMAGMELPSKAIRQQISSAIHIIVQLSRMRDGSRKVTSVSEITGMEGDMITMQDIFVFRQTGFDDKGKVLGKFSATGVRPMCLEEIKYKGIKLPNDIFNPDPEIQHLLFRR